MVQLTFKRCEVKYLLTDAQRARLGTLMATEGDMVPDEWGPSRVRNVYWDTPTALLVRRSQEHPYYKEKLRVRAYGDYDPLSPVFVELKKKCAGVVYKRRARMAPGDACALLEGQGTPTTQIERELDFAARRYAPLLPAMHLSYAREAFYARNDHDLRMTFDRDVRCRDMDVTLASSDADHPVLDAGLSILEVKTSKAMPLWLVSFLTEERLFKASVSKYGRAWQLCQNLTAPVPVTTPGQEARRVVGTAALPALV